MKSNKIKIVKPGRFIIQLECIHQNTTPQQIIRHLGKVGILQQTEHQYQLYSATSINFRVAQYKKETKIQALNTYYLIEDENTQAIVQYLRIQEMKKDSSQFIDDGNNDYQKKVDNLAQSQQIEFQHAISDRQKCQQKKVANFVQQEQKHIQSSQLKATRKDQMGKIQKTKSVQAKEIQKNKQDNDKTEEVQIIYERTLPQNNDTLQEEYKNPHSKSQILKPIKYDDDPSLQEIRGNQSDNKKLVITKKTKSIINFSKIKNSQSGILRNSQMTGNLAENEYEYVKITFMNNGEVIKQLNVKKMSIIKDSEILQKYDIFSDQNHEKSLKNKVTIALGDKIIYCQRKQVSKQLNPEQNLDFEDNLEENDSKIINRSPIQFKVHKKKKFTGFKRQNTGNDQQKPHDKQKNAVKFNVRKINTKTHDQQNKNDDYVDFE